MSEYSNDFELFWQTYPRRVGKRAAWAVWQRLKKGLPEINEMVKIIEKHKTQWDDPKFIPHPRTWLFQARWEDEIETKPTKPVYSGPRCPRCSKPGLPIAGSIRGGKICEDCFRKEEAEENAKIVKAANANQPESIIFEESFNSAED